jgi:hypothetical protein
MRHVGMSIGGQSRTSRAKSVQAVRCFGFTGISKELG